MIRSFTLLLLPIVAASVQAQPDTWERVKPTRDVQRQFTDPIRVGPIVPSEWRCLEQASVRDELKLTAIQKQKLDALSHPELLEAALPLLWSSYVTTEMVREWLPSARDSFLTATLTKEQQVRLRQVVYQLKEREFGAHAAFAMAAKDLGLGTDQLEDVTSIKGQRVEEIAKLVTSGERFEKVKKQVEAANGDTFEKMTEMLTRVQRERLKELKGKGFEGKVGFDVSDDVGVRGSKYPKHLFGLYDYELSYLRSSQIKIELSLTEKQQVDLSQAGSDTKGYWNLSIAPDLADANHRQAEDAINKVLTKAQRDRLDQISLQVRSRAGREAVCGHPAAVAALKLTPIQLKKLSEGTPVSEVLSQEQQGLLARLPGDAFLFLDELYSPVAPPRKLLDANVMYSSARSFLRVADRLRLSHEQIRKLREIAEDEPKFMGLIQRELSFSDSPPVAGASRSQTSGAVVAALYRTAVEEQSFNILDERQQSLVRQMFGRARNPR